MADAAADRARFLAALAKDGGHYGAVKRIAAELGLPPATVQHRIDRMGGIQAAVQKARQAQPQPQRRVCRCGQAVVNDETTDYRRCTSCRGGAGVRAIGHMALGGRWR